MRTQKIDFPDRQVLCVFPSERSGLTQAISELNLKDRSPVIILIGGEIDDQHAEVTRQAVQTIARVAEDINALVISGGTDMGVMAEIGQIRSQNNYSFPLLGIAPEKLVAWPGGRRSTKFLLWGTQRWPLESHYSHFVLVPGRQFGDESPWIFNAGTILSKGHRSVTILINGGEVSRKDINLSLERGRPVIVLSGTGRLADEIAGQPNQHKFITVVPADAEQHIGEAVQAALSSVNERSVLAQELINITM